MAWADRLDGHGYGEAGKVAVGPGDGVVVAGVDGGSHLLLASFSASGAVRFQESLEVIDGFTDVAPIDALAVDASGDIYLAGSPASGDLGPILGDATGAAGTGYVAKHAGEDGHRLWALSFAGGSDEGSTGAALVLVDDDVVLAGPALAATDLGGGALGAACADTGGFVARLAGADGAYRWSRSLGETESFGMQLFLDPAGRVELVSNQTGPSNLGGGPAAFAGTFASAYDAATGAFASVRPLVEVGDIRAGTMDGYWGLGGAALDGEGHLYVQTSFYGTATTAGGSWTSEGWGDVLLMRVPGAP